MIDLDSEGGLDPDWAGWIWIERLIWSGLDLRVGLDLKLDLEPDLGGGDLNLWLFPAGRRPRGFSERIGIGGFRDDLD